MIKKLWKFRKRIPFLLLYYCFFRYFPSSITPLFGRPSKWLRYHCCRHIFEYCGINVNIERGVLFGSGFGIKIGNNSGIGINSVVPSDIEIGNNVLMGPECFFLYMNHNFIEKSRTIRSQGYSSRMKTKIGNDVWIGREVLVTPGRTIADGTVIAARCCYCKDCPPYSVVGGNPVNIIKKRV